MPAGRAGQDPAGPVDDRAGGQVELAPPEHVGQVAEGAHHRDAGALVRLGQAVRDDRHLDAEDRRTHGLAEQVLVALVVGVGDQRDARRHQLRAGGLDEHRRAVGGVERDPVEGTRPLPILQLGLGDRGLVGHVPERRRLGHVRLAARQVAQERLLRGGARAARRWSRTCSVQSTDRPSRRNSASKTCSSSAVSRSHSSMKFCREIATGCFGSGVAGGSKSGVVRQRRVALDAEVVLHPALGRQAVVVPAHRVEHGLAAHPLEAGDDVGVGVGEHVADVQRTAHGRRRGVDRVDVLPRSGCGRSCRRPASPIPIPSVLQGLPG